MAVEFALGAALSYGVADFAGGLATRARPAARVAALAETVGLIPLLPVALLVGTEFSGRAMLLGAAGGACAAVGLVLYFRALAVGPMGVVAPAASVVGAAVPVAIGLVTGTALGPVAIVGIVVAALAVVLTAPRTADRDDAGAAPDSGSATSPGPDSRAAPRWRTARGPLYGLVSGIGFGLFFVFLHAAPAGSGVWPLVGARCGSLLLLGPALFVRRGEHAPGGWWLIVVSGLLDMAANLLFLLAARGSDLATSSVLVSLYPIVVVLLAQSLLAERLDARQRTGVAAALTAAVLLAL